MQHEYKVRDISLADFGRKELELAEYEMPGLMACAALFFSFSSQFLLAL